ncbi:hypothetical protein VT84_06215 [Gemmata sp. SH-PL17]|uniref:hypothetical protein n=1 Tax=Gemmata sp. SH-PL17 TaxID=1630693 RepID=UPI0004B35C92|nr:hypothetical protein [Gemmata sp. SH-PL17]AMV23970.1 hypothetical protein VT84_06215 [Gemmata sp. SH-PL17]
MLRAVIAFAPVALIVLCPLPSSATPPTASLSRQQAEQQTKVGGRLAELRTVRDLLSTFKIDPKQLKLFDEPPDRLAIIRVHATSSNGKQRVTLSIRLKNADDLVVAYRNLDVNRLLDAEVKSAAIEYDDVTP